MSHDELLINDRTVLEILAGRRMGQYLTCLMCFESIMFNI